MRPLEYEHAEARHGRTFRIRRGGCEFEGRWRVQAGEVCVESAYGCDRCSLGDAKPSAVAETLLGRLAFASMARLDRY